MKKALLLTAALGVSLAGGAFAQVNAPMVNAPMVIPPQGNAQQGNAQQGDVPQFDSPKQDFRIFAPENSPDFGKSNLVNAKAPDVVGCIDAKREAGFDARIASCTHFIDHAMLHGKEVAWAYTNRCIARKALGQSDMAADDCAQAIVEDPTTGLAYRVRAEIELARGQFDYALADFDQAVLHSDKSAALYTERGNLLLARGEAEKARSDFDYVVALEPKSAVAHLNRGSSLLAAGEIEKARADFLQATQLAPERAAGWFNLGVAEAFAGKADAAADHFRHALTLEPTNAYAGIWRFLARSGSAEATAELKAQAEKLNPAAWPTPAVRLFVGEANAAQVLAAAKTPDDACEAQYYLGRERLLKGAKDEALPYLLKAATICPKNFVEYDGAAFELSKLGPVGQ